MQRDYTEFAVESANRAIMWIHRYEEEIRRESGRDYSKVLMNSRIKKLELAQKNLRQAIQEIDVEIACLNRGFY